MWIRATIRPSYNSHLIYQQNIKFIVSPILSIHLKLISCWCVTIQFIWNVLLCLVSITIIFQPIYSTVFFIYLSYSVIQETLYLNHMDKLFLFRCPCYKKICVYLSRKINIKNTHQKVFNEVTVQESSNEKPVLSLTDCIIRFSLIVYRPSFFVSH